jgi:hypothetical protein
MSKEVKPYDHDHENEVTLFATTNFRNQQRRFGIKTDDRRKHIYIIGKTGMGKTTVLENFVLSDIYAGHGLCYIDPHGDTAQKILDFIPSHRINDIVYFNPGDVDNPIGFNIFEIKDDRQKHLIASGLMGVFKKIWPDVWSPRMEYILMNTILALLDAPGSSLLGITRILVDEEYRKRVVSLIQDPVVKTFWVKEFVAWQDKYRTEAIAPVQNKVGQFLSSRIIRNIVAQVKSTIDLRDIMDSRKIFLVNLSKGIIGEENMRLLGGMIITKMQMTVMERVDTPEHLRQDFYLYVDEFQNFANESFASILSEARKYRLNLTVAHQYIEQMDEVTRAAIFGNVGTIMIFRVGAADADAMEKEFAPVFTPEDLVNLRKFDIYLKLMIDGAASEPFSASTLPPIGNPTGSQEKVIRVSRERYSRIRTTIEDKVVRWSGLAPGEDKENDAENDILSAAREIGVSSEDLKQLQESSPFVKEPPKPEPKKKKEANFQIPCSICGEIQKLTFEPDWSKPWFCKDHLDMRSKIPAEKLKTMPVKNVETEKGPEIKPQILEKKPEIKISVDRSDKSGSSFRSKAERDRRDRQRNRPTKKVKNSPPVPLNIKNSAPILLKQEERGGLSLSALTPRNEIRSDDEKKPSTQKQKIETSEQSQPKSSKTGTAQNQAPSGNDSTDQSHNQPQQLKPGDVVKF